MEEGNLYYGWKIEELVLAGPAGGKGIVDVRFSHKNNACKRLLIALNEGMLLLTGEHICSIPSRLKNNTN